MIPKELAYIPAEPPILCGGWSKELKPDTESQKLADQILTLVNQEMKSNFSKLTVTKYKRQTVRGFNYVLWCDTNDKKSVKIHLFDPIDVDKAEGFMDTEIYSAEFL